jgi:hypothetical protein
MVEDVAQPHDQVRPLIQGQLDRRFERALEIPLALVDTTLGRERIVGPAQMGVAYGSHSHAPSIPGRCDNNKHVIRWWDGKGHRRK